ncbi:hypothetical protein Lal_00026250 [Lupinus albus]|nr:hypothetical protein Lal_00026250 [Lupinus albus]
MEEKCIKDEEHKRELTEESEHILLVIIQIGTLLHEEQKTQLNRNLEGLIMCSYSKREASKSLRKKFEHCIVIQGVTWALALMQGVTRALVEMQGVTWALAWMQGCDTSIG